MKPLLEMILPLLLEASILRTAIASECSFPLGMASGAIRDRQLSASSSWSDTWSPQEARLNVGNAWYPSSYSTSEWLQIDLLERTSITQIQTQGDWHGLTPYYVKSFKLLYSNVETNWNTYQENGSDKTFRGNSNANGVKTNDIDPPIAARFIRLMAVTWNNGIAFRLELLGCELLPTTTSVSPLTTATSPLIPTSKVETTVPTSTATSTSKKTAMQTTRSRPMRTYPTRSTKGITLTPQKSTSPVSSGSGMSSPSSNNTGGNSDGFAANQGGTTSGAIIGGAVAAGVVIIIIAIVSIFFIRRRRSKGTGERESSPQPEKEGTVDNIYYGGVTFAANGNASTNGNVSIGQSEGMVDNDLYSYAGTTNGDVTFDQSEGMVDNHIYAGTNNDNVPIDQSEGTVDNNLYAGTGDACAETKNHDVDDGTEDNVYYNLAHASEEGSVENDIYC